MILHEVDFNFPVCFQIHINKLNFIYIELQTVCAAEMYLPVNLLYHKSYFSH
jgi:hypothetical protein